VVVIVVIRTTTTTTTTSTGIPLVPLVSICTTTYY
jgi:hypothetical protein